VFGAGRFLLTFGSSGSNVRPMNNNDCDGCENGCSWCALPDLAPCENCGNRTDRPVIDQADPGLKFCSPECRAEFVTAAESDEGWVPEGDDTKPVVGGTVG